MSGRSSRYDWHPPATGGTRTPASSRRSSRSRFPRVQTAVNTPPQPAFADSDLCHAPQDLFVLAQPDEVVRIHLPSVRHQGARSSGVLAANVALPAESHSRSIGAVGQQQLDSGRLPRARPRAAPRPAATVRVGPRRSAPADQQPHDRPVPEFDGRRERALPLGRVSLMRIGS